MRYILAFLVAWLLSAPAEARHLCVFIMDVPRFVKLWEPEHPDIMVKAKDWRYLDEFLKKVQTKYNNCPDELLIDIDCHGCAEDGLLYIDGDNYTSMGSVLERIEEFFPDRQNLTVVFESCYAGRCYKLTSRGDKKSYLPGGITQAPPFPVYGIQDDMPNIGTLQYIEYINKDKTYQVDLREYETRNLKEPYWDVWDFIRDMYDTVANFWENLRAKHTL